MKTNGGSPDNSDKWAWAAFIIVSILMTLMFIFGCRSQKLVEQYTNGSGVESVEYKDRTWNWNGETRIYMNNGGIMILPGRKSVPDMCSDGILEYTRYKEREYYILPNPDIHKIRCIRD